MRRSLEQRLTVLSEMPGPNLRQEWDRVAKSPAPQLSPDLLRLGLAWKFQERALGGLSREVHRVLAASKPASHAARPRRKLTPGTRLVRDWHGVGHSVTVLENGFLYDGREWRSLTAIARAITGVHWNGPRFFGLTGGAAQ